MVITSAQPGNSLRAYFKEYYYLHLDSGQEQKTIPVIDDCCYDFVFYKECKAELTFGRPKSSLDVVLPVFTIHQLPPPFTIRFLGTLTFFTVKLNPWFNGHFFSGLTNRGICDAHNLLPASNDLQQAFLGSEEPAQLFAKADQLLAQDTPLEKPGILLAQEMCELILDKQGMISVNELSDRFGRSRQYLNKVFKQEVLYSLKKYITTVRILDLVKYRSKRPDITLTDLAYQYGYFDQAHFIHDFKNVCGVKPRYYFEHLPEFILRH